VASHSLVHFDLSTGKIANQIRFEADGQVSTNRITSHPSMIIGAFEDNMVRIFDQNRMTYSFKAHNDSVMSVSLLSNMNQFFTCGHDGFVKLWDLRKLEPVSIFKVKINLIIGS
jgi:WD40 repeat protein